MGVPQTSPDASGTGTKESFDALSDTNSNGNRCETTEYLP